MKKELNIQHSTIKTENSAYNTQNSPLPEGWVWVRLGEICDIQTGKKDVNEGNPNGKYHFFTCAASPLRSDTYSFEGESIILPGNGANVGLVIYFNGKCELYQRTYILNNFKAYGKYVFYYMYGNWKKGLGKQFGSATNYIRLNNITDFKIPIAPLSEQQRIVSKIEELFTKLDAGVDALKKAKEQIKRYRQAVLKYAFEGKLTEKWREANRDKLESASVLLERIKEERKKKPGKKYKELPPIDTSELPELPKGWVWVRLWEICDVQTGKKDVNEGNPNGKYQFFTCAASPLRSDTYSFEGESIILPGNGANVGLVIFFNGKCELYQRTYILNNFKAYGKYVFYYMYDNWKKGLGKQFGSATNYIRLNNITDFKIPIAPLSEQQKIVEEIERRFSVADEVEKAIDNSLKQAERLRQSILKKAFEGKLVPQDPSDEPAEKTIKENYEL